mgnify:FL=1|tara:strand:- start:393 stop:1106 length:714 start_codon:yes stop_codon:yes gene_type:complete
MALPQINTFPWYDIVIPSTNETVRYRPYNVGEQKTLLMSFESGEASNIAKALLDIVANCVEGKVNKHILTTFDVEYMFLQIRSKSVGEKSNIILTCSECKHENEITVSVDKIDVDRNKWPEKLVKISEDYSIELKFPTYIDVINDKGNLDDTTVSELMFDTVLQSLYKLHTPDELISFSDEPKDEVLKFLNNLTAEQYQKLIEFVNNLPRLKQELNYECAKCKAQNTHTLEGLYDFF